MQDTSELTDTPQEGVVKPKRHARANKRRKAAKPAEPEFAGLTAKTCCAACNENRCVISGINVCAHPNKGGLQAAQKHDPKTSSRFKRAKEFLDA